MADAKGTFNTQALRALDSYIAEARCDDLRPQDLRTLGPGTRRLEAEKRQTRRSRNAESRCRQQLSNKPHVARTAIIPCRSMILAGARLPCHRRGPQNGPSHPKRAMAYLEAVLNAVVLRPSPLGFGREASRKTTPIFGAGSSPNR